MYNKEQTLKEINRLRPYVQKLDYAREQIDRERKQIRFEKPGPKYSYDVKSIDQDKSFVFLWVLAYFPLSFLIVGSFTGDYALGFVLILLLTAILTFTHYSIRSNSINKKVAEYKEKNENNIREFEEKNKEIRLHNQVVEAEVEKKINEYQQILNSVTKSTFIPKDYLRGSILSKFETYLNNYRVDNLREAINLYEMESKSEYQHDEQMWKLSDMESSMESNMSDMEHKANHIESNLKGKIDELEREVEYLRHR
nr:hypothetical protein 15 [Bacillaceae bacterium]